jgi:hypothetical protein
MTSAEKGETEKLAQLIEAVGLNPSQITKYPRRYRVTRLQLMQRQVVIGAVLTRYTYIDEPLSCAVAWEFFDLSRSFPEHWRTKRFKAFNYFVLDQVYMAQKLKLVQYLHPVPKRITSTVMALNDLRNGLAHSFFPENRKQPPRWGGTLIFQVEAMKAFDADTQEVVSWFDSTGLADRGRKTGRR